MLQFRLLGIPVTVQPWHWIMLGLFGAVMFNPVDRNGLLTVALFVLAGFISVLVHEYGHALTGRRYGSRPEIILHGIGGVDFDIDCAAENVELIKGLFEDTMAIDTPVALAHIDCDWYDSVMTCLQRIVGHLVPGGRLVIDDYDHWSGCKTAIDEFFADRHDEFEFQHFNRLHIVKR